MQIWICEDNSLYCSSIQQKIINWSLSTRHCDVCTSIFHSSEDLLEQWSRGIHPHLFLLDIEIPNEMNGLELAQKIRLYDQEACIVFITNYNEYVYQGYTVNALRYLKKPITEEDLFPCLDIAYRHYSLLHQNHSVLSIPGEKLVILYAEILYIQSYSPSLEIKTSNIQNSFLINYRISKLYNLLPPDLFSFCHRCYIVNLSEIRILKKTQLTLSNGETLPVSNKFVNELFEKFNAYHQRGCHYNDLGLY